MPSPNVQGSGTPTLVIDTPNTVYTTSSTNNYSAAVNLVNMQSGDTIVIRIKKKVVSGGSFALIDEYTKSGVQARPVFEIPFIPCPYGFELVLEQTDGTGRVVEWNVVTPT